MGSPSRMSGARPIRVRTDLLSNELIDANAISDVFVGDAASIWKANKLTEHSTCTCTPETGCDENCHNRYMLYECDDTNCKLGPELCRNRAFSELKRRSKARGKFNIGVEVIKTEDRGYGVRSNRSFDPNQIIVEYTGEILTQDECERRMRTVYKKSDVCIPHATTLRWKGLTFGA